MSTRTTIAAVAATILLAASALTQFAGPSINTEIEIAAPPSVVWQELSNGGVYHEWNPFIRHFSGELRTGNRMNVTVQLPGHAPMDFSPLVLVVEESRELRWLGRLGFRGILDGEHSFVLEETSDGSTILHHNESFTGLLSYPILALIRQDTRHGFEAMNAALKARVEGLT